MVPKASTRDALLLSRARLNASMDRERSMNLVRQVEDSSLSSALASQMRETCILAKAHIDHLRVQGEKSAAQNSKEEKKKIASEKKRGCSQGEAGTNRERS